VNLGSPNLANSCDIVIAGGGLAGLAMAMALAPAPFAALKVLVIEPRTHYQRDRTWSFWACGPHAYSHLERHAWARWRVAASGKEVICGTDDAFLGLEENFVPNVPNGAKKNKSANEGFQRSRYTYRSIDADAFYAEALTQIAACPHIELRLGLGVNDIYAGQGNAPCQVVLSSGEVVHARLVLDARAGHASPLSDPPDHLAQHFLGWEIATEQDAFDPSTVDLMDFEPAADGLHFFYVLPYSKRRALIEATWVSPAHLHQDHAERLARYISQRFGPVVYQTVYTEQASLPLLPTLVKPAHQRRGVIRLGRAAGTLRASTGFAFLETVADCQRVARRLASRQSHLGGLQAFRRSRADLGMDKLFLRVLTRHWTEAPALFMALFGHVPSVRLLRFLSGQATWLDRAYVVACLPKWRFLRSLL
jgi:lycopene beta-cyclase